MTTPRSSAFPPAARLHDQRDYGRVFNRQQKHGAVHVVALVRPRAPDEPLLGRLGVMVSTKVAAKAVRRHQLKRWVRELFRRELAAALAGWDLVVLFRRDPPADGHRELEREVREAVARALDQAPSGPSRRGRPQRPRPGSPARPGG